MTETTMTLTDLDELDAYFGEYGELPHGIEEALLCLARRALEQEASWRRGPKGVTLCKRCFHPTHEHTDGCPEKGTKR